MNSIIYHLIEMHYHFRLIDRLCTGLLSIYHRSIAICVHILRTAVHSYYILSSYFI